MCFVGKTTPPQDNEINLLRAGVLVTKIGDREITMDTIMTALKQMDELSATILENTNARRVVHSANHSDHKKYWQHKIICRDSALSMPTIGMSFNALLINKDTTPTLDGGGLDFLLAFLANFLNLEDVALGRNGRRTRNALQERADALWPRIKGVLGF